MAYPSVTFIDIETAPQYKHWSLVPERIKELFQKRFASQIAEAISIEKFYMDKAGLYAEFGQIVCVSIGRIKTKELVTTFYMKSFASRFEKILLEQVAENLQKSTGLCAHNGKEFDFPYLFRRFIINGLPVPALLNVVDVSPWKTNLEDTMQMWSLTQWKYNCSLDLLCELLGLRSPKRIMDGSDVANLFHTMLDNIPEGELPFAKEERVLKQLAYYCNEDVFADANVYLKLKGLDILTEEQIVYL